jgi:arsenate reductase
LINNPDILKAPIVMKGDKIIMMSNPQEMLYFVK